MDTRSPSHGNNRSRMLMENVKCSFYMGRPSSLDFRRRLAYNLHRNKNSRRIILVRCNTDIWYNLGHIQVNSHGRRFWLLRRITRADLVWHVLGERSHISLDRTGRQFGSSIYDSIRTQLQNISDDCFDSWGRIRTRYLVRSRFHLRNLR